MADVLILRPKESGQQTAAALQRLGLDTIVDPLFELQSIPWDAPPPANFDALMLTSVNAITYGGTKLAEYLNLPVLAVGHATAKAAKAAGFTVVHSGEGGADDLLQSLPDNNYQQILRLTGKHHIKAGASDRQIQVCKVYESVALPLGSNAQRTLKKEAVILLYSVRAAEILTAEMATLGLDRALHHIAALSDNIASAAGSGWKSIASAPLPSEDALLSLTARLCQSLKIKN